MGLSLFFYNGLRKGDMCDVIKFIFDNETLQRYNDFYFKKYPKRRVFPIKSPIPLSLNQWSIMPRHEANNFKKKWREFGEWVVDDSGLRDKHVKNCRVSVQYFYGDARRRDLDNYGTKQIFDAFVSSGFLEDDDYTHVQSLTFHGGYCKGNPRMEITFFIGDEDAPQDL